MKTTKKSVKSLTTKGGEIGSFFLSFVRVSIVVLYVEIKIEIHTTGISP
jgi:hypothetical protein